ncbi:MAG: ISL3 family transposase [Candidatus Aenigmatarchaeota archaeon]|nr:MAG: ISL3 family transposase [Candidatus Aenigmarchaeota archaeon]
MKKIIQEHLGLNDIKIFTIETNSKNEIEITIKSTLKGTNCHNCGDKITKPYGYDRPLRLRHLSLLGSPVYILVKLPRYQCDHCKKQPKTTQRPSWHKKNSSFTVPYEEWILLSAINSTEVDVSQKEDLTEEQVKGIVNRYIDNKMDWNKVKYLDVLGIDEISLKKGHQSFIVVISSLYQGKKQILALLKGRKKETVKGFLKTLPDRLRATLKWVCSDMYEGFINASKEVFGDKVRVVIDRFHVAKLYRSKVDSLRKQELKRLKKCLSTVEYKELKGAMWALRRPWESLSEEKRQVLGKLFYHSKELEKAYTAMTKLTHIFNDSISKSSGTRRLKSWIKAMEASSLNCFSSFISTLQHHFNEIANYFVSHKSSGFVEGLNNKIKVIKRRCYGIFRLDHLFQRIFLDIQGYELFK